ncbi:MAG: 3-isopropylmalate dehydrogenase [Vampirovibrionales bacterium]|nr:3-isopropylmalate dehydrogenase [Vampirovibrionales bacterium]
MSASSQKSFDICILPGDGIGPEIMSQGVKVLKAVEKRSGVTFNLKEAAIGGAGIEAAGVPLPPETLALAQQSDAVYMASVGDFKYDTLDPKIRPEQGLLQIRKALGLYCNLRPVKAYDILNHISTLKPEILSGVDIMVVRELTGGVYFGQPKGRETDRAFDTMVYTHGEIERIAKKAFEVAQSRSKKLCSVDKANVLATSQAWREIVTGLAQDYADVELSHMYVDNAAMQLILNPKQFDVILTENMFGDILSDEASMLTGSLGMLPSASIGEKGISLYEPCHGSAPQFTGQNKVNPIAQILSAAMMLQYSLGLPEEARAVETAVEKVLSAGYRTFDIIGNQEEASTLVGTEEMGSRVVEALLQLPAKVPT